MAFYNLFCLERGYELVGQFNVKRLFELEPFRGKNKLERNLSTQNWVLVASVKDAQSQYFELFWPSTILPLN